MTDDLQNACNVPAKVTPMVQIPFAQANASAQFNQAERQTSSLEPFLQLVAQRLDQGDASKRRKLENAILEAMVLAEKE